MTTHNSEEKDKAVAALIELAVKGAVADALQNAEGAPLADTFAKASRATAHVMNLCVAAELFSPAVPSYSGPGDASCACAHCDDQPGGCVLCCE